MIGRKSEIEELNKIYSSDKAELVAVYGRRRVGKTYLIDETFKERMSFRHAGLSPVEGSMKRAGALKVQLEQFYYSLRTYGYDGKSKPHDWLEAFFMLGQLLEKKHSGARQVVFLDELPWLDTPRSGFLTAFEGFWNSWACHRSDIMIIVCGSANSWILDNLINNHGGLYNRVTYEILLNPFTLSECREYYQAKNIPMSDYDVIQSYMILGGIPYYMGYMSSGMSLAQNIDNMLFREKAKLRNEYDRLFASIFNNPATMKAIVKALNSRNSGLTRKELVAKAGITEGGTLSKSLNALIASSFITKYIPFGAGKRESRYKVTDPFCIFYLQFIDGKTCNDTFWQQNENLPAVSSWRGFAFENVCFNHIRQIKQALGVASVNTRQSAWSKKNDEGGGAQIDLVIDRDDNVVNVCEMKFYSGEFAVDKKYHSTLMNRHKLIRGEVSPKKAIHNTLITTYGLKYNEYSGDFTNVVLMEDLFR